MRAVAVPLLGLGAFAALPFEGGLWPLTAVAGLVAGALALPLTARRVDRISASHHPVAEAISAVCTLATVVLVGFASSYYAIAIRTEQITGIETKLDAFYFTVVTLGTVGFGDIVPVGQTARGLVAMQILLNLTVVGLSIRWIGKALAERREQVAGT